MNKDSLKEFYKTFRAILYGCIEYIRIHVQMSSQEGILERIKGERYEVKG